MRIAIIVIVLALLGGGIYWYLQSGSAGSNTNTSANTNATSSHQTQTLADLMSANQSQQCTFSLDDPNGRQDWTMYVDGEKMRGNYTVTTSDGSDWSGSTIRDGVYSYNWGTYQGQVTGTKLKLASLASDANANLNTNSADPGREFDINQSVDMTCKNWTPDASKFVPPSDVNFTDLTATVESANEQTQAAACSACDAMSDESAKQACKTSLSCS